MSQKNTLIGKNLRKFATENFASLAELAENLNVKPQSLHKYLNGDRLPGAELIKKLIELGCDANWLLTGKNQNSDNSEFNRLENEFKKIKKRNLLLIKKISAISSDIEILGEEIINFEKELKSKAAPK